MAAKPSSSNFLSTALMTSINVTGYEKIAHSIVSYIPRFNIYFGRAHQKEAVSKANSVQILRYRFIKAATENMTPDVVILILTTI
jgi:hypothetical protein